MSPKFKFNISGNDVRQTNTNLGISLTLSHADIAALDAQHGSCKGEQTQQRNRKDNRLRRDQQRQTRFLLVIYCHTNPYKYNIRIIDIWTNVALATGNLSTTQVPPICSLREHHTHFIGQLSSNSHFKHPPSNVLMLQRTNWLVADNLVIDS